MKKKIKLITTFASLGLALALMVFGVYAAILQTVTISNQVSFSATPHVKATVTLVAPKATNATVKEDSKGAQFAAATATFTAANATDLATSWALGDVELEVGTTADGKMTYTYGVTIANNETAAAEKSSLKVTWTKAPEIKENYDADGYSVAFDGNKTTGDVITAGNNATYTVTLEVNPATSINNVDLGLTFTLEMKEA